MGMWNSTPEDGMNGAFQIPLNGGIVANCIVSDGKDPCGTIVIPWEHVSAHINDHGRQRTPSWDEMCKLKDLFWDDEECVCEFHPPKSEYVNNHPHVLHLWKWTGGEFPRPNSLLVGIKSLGEIKP